MSNFKVHACVFLSLAAAAAPAHANNYEFVNIADTRGSFDGFNFSYEGAVSDTGNVAFIGNQGGVPGTYLGNGGAVQQVVVNVAPPAGFWSGYNPAINESGVASGLVESSFAGPRHNKIQLYEASGTRTIGEVIAGETFEAGFFYPAINNSGAVVFGTYVNDFSTREASINRWFEGTSTTIVETTAGFTFLGDVQLNDAGDVAFQGYTDDLGALRSIAQTERRSPRSPTAPGC